MSGLTSLQPNQSFVSLMAAQGQAPGVPSAATLGGFGKIMQVNGSGAHVAGGGALPILTSYRYAPYQLPTAISTTQAQVAALMAQQQYQVSQSRQDQTSPSQIQPQAPQTQHPQGLPHTIPTTLNLSGSANPSLSTIAQAGHLSAVLPTVSISNGVTTASVTSATSANNLALAKYAVAAPAINPNPFQVGDKTKQNLQIIIKNYTLY